MESGPDAIFGRVAGRKLPNKLNARQDAEPFRTRKVHSCYAIEDVADDKSAGILAAR